MCFMASAVCVRQFVLWLQQFAFGSLFSGLKNLFVTVCLAASTVGFGQFVLTFGFRFGATLECVSRRIGFGFSLLWFGLRGCTRKLCASSYRHGFYFGFGGPPGARLFSPFDDTTIIGGGHKATT